MVYFCQQQVYFHCVNRRLVQTEFAHRHEILDWNWDWGWNGLGKFLGLDGEMVISQASLIPDEHGNALPVILFDHALFLAIQARALETS